jgi:hypothetical protein
VHLVVFVSQADLKAPGAPSPSARHRLSPAPCLHMLACRVSCGLWGVPRCARASPDRTLGCCDVHSALPISSCQHYLSQQCCVCLWNTLHCPALT